MSLDKKRWLMLVAGLLVNLCQGAAYASSVFAVPMLTHLGLILPNGKPDMVAWSSAFTWNLGCLPVGMLLSSKMADRGNPRLGIIIGSILFGSGMFLAGFADSLLAFQATFGLMMGIGSGMAYGAVVSVAVKWFPDMRGLASGLAVGALGFGQFVIAPVGDWLMAIAQRPEDQAVLFALKVLGAAFIVIMATGSIILQNPPKDYLPKGFVAKTPAGGGTAPGANDLAWTEMIRKGRFWLLYVLYACGAFSGLMIISQAKQIAAGVGLAAIGTMLTSRIGLANAGGRVLWGWISDKIGRPAAMALMFALTAGCTAAIPAFGRSEFTLTALTLVIGICYGGYLGTFPSLCADSFGAKNMAVNYAVLFSAFSVAAIAGPKVGGYIANTNAGNYDQAFYIAAIVAGAGLVLTMFLRTSKPAKQVN